MHHRLRRALIVALFAAPLASLASLADASPNSGPLPLARAAQAYLDRAGTAGLRAAYLATLADDAKLMAFHASGRTGIERVVATRIAADARFHAEPLVITEAASHDLGYVWGRYRLEFTRASDGRPVTAYGTFVDIWRNEPDTGWKLCLENWAPLETPDATTLPPSSRFAPPAAASPITVRQAEAQFLEQAAGEGIRPAFLAHIANDGTVMFLHATGRAAVEQAVATLPADARVKGDPEIIVEAASGDLGFAYGSYRFTATIDAKPFSADGHFITIWKRQPDGAWRIVLDHGTQNPEPAAPAASSAGSSAASSATSSAGSSATSSAGSSAGTKS